ncbi:zonadhesin isoform X2 [Rhipicephalus sanguineus]|uniref:zonadhesin isoform X2 n=1 Tax=Rhipicephalus sanguineus TaxID=34632 RepID=UPI0020C30EEF|nr:zonadhesin isoform X2 [Rhipicephalus sanguineus]
MATVEFWILAFAVTCAIYPDYAQGQFLKRLRRCTLPHERRPWFWERTEQYCSASRVLEHRSRTQSCVCEPGYYRDEETNNCYDARLCGHCDSSKHERFNRCTNDCEAVCGKQVIQQCDKPCVPGCECMKGYIRKHKNGPCVPIQTCPPKCPAYMTFEMHRERCPRICNVAREDSCSETNEGPGCACAPGFVLHPYVPWVECVPVTSCAPRCPLHSTFHVCTSNCEPHCHAPRPSECKTRCQNGGCVCNAGFVKASYWGEEICVPWHDCHARRQ